MTADARNPHPAFADDLAQGLARFTLRRVELRRPRTAGKKPRAADPSVAPAPARVDLRPVALRTGPCWQFALRVGTRELHENHPPEAAARRCLELLDAAFDELRLVSSQGTRTWIRPPGQTWKQAAKQRDRPGEERRDKPPPAAVLEPHNRAPRHLIPEGTPCPFLHAIGVMTADGKVRAARQHKFRQINRFLELVDDVLPALTAPRAEPSAAPSLLRIVDFGSGKSYLTFALYHLLSQIRRLPAALLAVDRNAQVVADCARLAGQLGWSAPPQRSPAPDVPGLTFHVGDIARVDLPGGCDLAVSLHACDTATDAALRQAVRWGARAILAVPCCQHEIAPQLAAPVQDAMLRHGLVRERLGALVTDSLRAQWLETQGYSAQLIEFIDLEHTAKNVLIRATRRRGSPDPGAQAALEALLQSWGVSRFTLLEPPG